jgi:hypothetical protein
MTAASTAATTTTTALPTHICIQLNNNSILEWIKHIYSLTDHFKVDKAYVQRNNDSILEWMKQFFSYRKVL